MRVTADFHLLSLLVLPVPVVYLCVACVLCFLRKPCVYIPEDVCYTCDVRNPVYLCALVCVCMYT